MNYPYGCNNKRMSLLNLRFYSMNGKKLRFFLETRENGYRMVKEMEVVELSQNSGVKNPALRYKSKYT